MTCGGVSQQGQETTYYVKRIGCFWRDSEGEILNVLGMSQGGGGEKSALGNGWAPTRLAARPLVFPTFSRVQRIKSYSSNCHDGIWILSPDANNLRDGINTVINHSFTNLESVLSWIWSIRWKFSTICRKQLLSLGRLLIKAGQHCPRNLKEINCFPGFGNHLNNSHQHMINVKKK